MSWRVQHTHEHTQDIKDCNMKDVFSNISEPYWDSKYYEDAKENRTKEACSRNYLISWIKSWYYEKKEKQRWRACMIINIWKLIDNKTRSRIIDQEASWMRWALQCWNYVQLVKSGAVYHAILHALTKPFSFLFSVCQLKSWIKERDWKLKRNARKIMRNVSTWPFWDVVIFSQDS